MTTLCTPGGDRIADRTPSSERRSASDRLNEAILESAIDYAIISMDLGGNVTNWNKGAEDILGWSEAEMLGQRAHVFFTEEDIAVGIPETEMRRALLDGRGKDERWHRRKNGSRFWASGEMMPLRNKAGEPEGFIKLVRDRTMQRLEAEKVRSDAEFMRSVLSASADCIKVLDLDGRLTFMSEGGMRVMEVSDFNAIKGCPWPDLWEGQGNTEAKAALQAAKAGGVGHFQGGASTMAGNARWWDVQVTPILDAQGRPERLLSVSRDITVQKRAEQAIAESEERYRGLFTGMQEGFFTAEMVRDGAGVPVDYRFQQVNDAFAAQSGLPPDIAGRTIRSLVPDLPQWVLDTYARAVDTGEPQLFEIDVPQLHRSFEVRAYKAGREQFSCLFLNITERRSADARRAAMIELGDRLRDVTDRADIGPLVGEILGRTLDLSCAGYGAVDQDRETVSVESDWTAPGIPSLTGLHAFREYGSFIDDLTSGRTVAIADVAADPRTAVNRDALSSIGIGALLNLPLMERGRFVTLFFALKGQPHAWSDQEIGFLRNVADRTRAAIARLEAEEQQRVLNLELSHRMKNTLAMVQALASQTLRSVSERDAVQAFEQRIGALGKAHDVLLKQDWAAARMSDVMAGVVTLQGDPSRFDIEGPPVELAPSAALSLSLLVHELGTNAVKHGALSNESGRVRVRWAVEPAGDTASLTLSWVEQGGPPAREPTRKGFGSRLIRMGLAGTGNVEQRYGPTGYAATFRAPLSALCQAE